MKGYNIKEVFFICKEEFNIPSSHIDNKNQILTLYEKDIFWIDPHQINILNNGNFNGFEIKDPDIIILIINNSDLNENNETPLFIEVSSSMIRESKINKLLGMGNTDILN